MDEKNSHNQNNGNHCQHKRIISKSLGRPRNFSTLKVQYVICEGQSIRVICHYCDKSSKITWPSGPLQQQFIPIRTMTKWTTLQVLSIQCRLFESTNVVIRRYYVQTSPTSWKWKPFVLQLDLGSNTPRCNHSDSWTSIQGCYQYSHDLHDVWK
jgi:hypothetical protein